MQEQKFKNLPLGLSDLGEIITGGYVYVDKTRDIHRMITTGKYYFLSRPRRFGKSLLISTLHAIFAGKKELFKNLWIGSSDMGGRIIRLFAHSITFQSPLDQRASTCHRNRSCRSRWL